MLIRTAVALLLAGSIAGAQDAKESLNQALKNMGDIKTVQYTGSGATFNLGQSVSPTKPWPRVEVKSFTQAYDYEKASGRFEVVGAQGPGPTQLLSGDRAWNQQAANAIPVGPNIAAARQLQLLMSPHGFLRAALSSNATAKNTKLGGRKVTQVTFMQGKQRVTGTISPDNVVEKVETWIDNPVLGDMHVQTDYTGYRDFGGFKFPARIVQQQGGFTVADFTVTEAKTSTPLALTAPSAAAPAAAVTVASEKLGDGVWHLTGGSHHSVLVEFRDHVAVIEAPQSEERSSAVIAEVKKLVPNKPIRYLVNTHHHFDHSGGLRTYIAEGATIVTHEINKPFYERIAKLPHTLNPDRLSREKKKAKIVAVAARHALTDGARTLEIHHVQGSPHNEGILVAYLPKEKILSQVDLFTPLAPNAAPPATPNPATLNLFENIERLKLDVGPIASLHGRVATVAELRKTIGR